MPFILFPFWTLYPAYTVAVLVLRLYRFYSEKKEKLFVCHTLILLIMFVLLYLVTGLRRRPAYLVILLSLVYIAWTYLADWWIREQISPSSTVLIGKAVNLYPELFHVIGTMEETDPEKIAEFIDLYRVPVLMSDKEVNGNLKSRLDKLGVMIVILGNETTWPRYEGMKFIVPALDE